jgi:uncharacterized protein (DUF433 family)
MKSRFVVVDKDILGGTPAFKGTRVPVKALFDYLEGNHTLDDFLDDFPSVSRKAAIGLLEEANKTFAKSAA